MNKQFFNPPITVLHTLFHREKTVDNQIPTKENMLHKTHIIIFTALQYLTQLLNQIGEENLSSLSLVWTHFQTHHKQRWISSCI